MKTALNSLAWLYHRIRLSNLSHALTRRKSELAAFSAVLIVVLVVSATSTLISSSPTSNEESLPTTGLDDYFPPSQRSEPTLSSGTSDLPIDSGSESPPGSADAPTASTWTDNGSTQGPPPTTNNAGQPGFSSVQATVPQTALAPSTSLTNGSAHDPTSSSDPGNAKGFSEALTVDETLTVQFTDESSTSGADSSTDESSLSLTTSSEPTIPMSTTTPTTSTTESTSTTDSAPIEPELRGPRPGGDCPGSVVSGGRHRHIVDGRLVAITTVSYDRRTGTNCALLTKAILYGEKSYLKLTLCNDRNECDSDWYYYPREAGPVSIEAKGSCVDITVAALNAERTEWILPETTLNNQHCG